MIYPPPLVKAGVLWRPHGNKGEILLELFFGKLKAGTWLHLPVDGKPVPFLVSACKQGPSGFIVKFKGISTRDAAAAFTGLPFLAEETNKPLPGPGVDENLEGYTLRDIKLGDIGKVSGIQERQTQPLLEVLRPDGKSLLIPLHPDIIIRADNEKKILHADLPEGLTEL